MESLSEIIKKYNFKHYHKIDKICSPLKDHLSISIFIYYRIETDGKFVTLSNFPEQIDFYYCQELYLVNPFLVHPSLLRPGCLFTETTPNQDYQRAIHLSQEKFHMYNTFLVVTKSALFLEGFLFGNKVPNFKKIPNYLNYLDLLEKFSVYFKQEAGQPLGRMAAEQLNMHKAKGEAFLKREEGLPLSNEGYAKKFTSAISTLSLREQQCLELFRQGRSAQSTAAILGISRRTVEHYFDSIKIKLKCRSKSDLHEKAFF